MSERDVKLFLCDILEAISKIEKFVEGMDYDSFVQDEKTRDAVVRNLEIIGEAAKNLPDEFKKEHSGIPWKAMAGMRDKLIHAYFGVSVSIVWETVKNDLPALKRQVKHLLDELDMKKE